MDIPNPCVKSKYFGISIDLIPTNGKVLIAGGGSRDHTISLVNDMQSERFKLAQAIALLGDSNIVISGGSNQVEIFDVWTGKFSSVAQFEEAHYYGTATALHDGSVLILGGYNNKPQSTTKAWLFKM